MHGQLNERHSGTELDEILRVDKRLAVYKPFFHVVPALQFQSYSAL